MSLAVVLFPNLNSMLLQLCKGDLKGLLKIKKKNNLQGKLLFLSEYSCLSAEHDL